MEQSLNLAFQPNNLKFRVACGELRYQANIRGEKKKHLCSLAVGGSQGFASLED